MVAVASDDSKSNQALIAVRFAVDCDLILKEVAAKTDEILTGLKSLGSPDATGRLVVAPEAIKVIQPVSLCSPVCSMLMATGAQDARLDAAVHAQPRCR